MNVLVIAEDDRNDRFILLPINSSRSRSSAAYSTRWDRAGRSSETRLHNYSKLRQNCPELRNLETRIKAWLVQSAAT